MKHIVFSGIQPSGQLHIGNYFGAIQNWLELQKDKNNDCIFAIVDYHALTEGPNPRDLEQRIFDASVDFLASGLDPKKSTIILQSLITEHTDLAWILNCITPVSWLERVPTFKDKAQQFKDNMNMGLLDYPVLMAADILLYHADLVPVGLDQLPHLKLTRQIARSFNARYGKTLVEPVGKVTQTPKLMSLNDPTKKMSKSLGAKAYIALSDTPETIADKIKAMPTATGGEKEVIQELFRRIKEIKAEFQDLNLDHHELDINTEDDLAKLRSRLGEKKYATFMALFNFYMLMYIFTQPNERKKFLLELKDGQVKFSEYKALLAERIAAYPAFVAFRKKRATLLKNPAQVEKILKAGSHKASLRAKKNILAIKRKVGLA